MRRLSVTTLLLAVGLSSPRARAQVDVASKNALGVEEVVMSAVTKHPAIDAAKADKAIAEAEVLSAYGAFDPVWRTRSVFVPVGYYDSKRLDTLLVQPTTLGGTNVFAGYRIGAGNFPIYDGKLETLGFGEVRAGVSVPLWRDLMIDSRRAALWSAKIAPRLADAGVALQKMEVARVAAIRYWNWVEAGRTLAIAKDLLDLAEKRDAQLGERVTKGDLAAIEQLDNQRTILGRKGTVITVERAYLAAAYELSIFYRDAAGATKTPTESQVPSAMPEPQALAVLDVNDVVRKAIAKRPDLIRLVAVQEQIALEGELAANGAKPAIDFQAIVSKDFGPGPGYLRPTEVELAIVIDIPLFARTANGKLAAANAKTEKVAAQKKLLEDRIAADVKDALAAEAAARARVSLARTELALAKKLADAERDAFALGTSTMLIVNLREQAVAEAAVREVVALADHQRAVAIYRATTATQTGVL